MGREIRAAKQFEDCDADAKAVGLEPPVRADFCHECRETDWSEGSPPKCPATCPALRASIRETNRPLH